MRRRRTLIAAMLLHKGEGGLICGTNSTTARHLHYIDRVIGKRPGASVYAAMNALVLPNRQLFLVDTHVNLDPTAEQIAEITTNGRRCGTPLRHRAQSRSAVAFQLWQL
jgi:malate dehydrogenase (oxaloacetate-decarboxylating)(NADP+)